MDLIVELIVELLSLAFKPRNFFSNLWINFLIENDESICRWKIFRFCSDNVVEL